MHYRTLGRTNLNISVVGVGTWQFGGEWGVDFTQPEVNAILAAAQDCGINFIDTAECYGDHLSERFIGHAIAGRRDQWIVATKFGHHFHKNFDRSRHFDATDVTAQLDASLAALQTDYIDLLQCHSATDEEFDTPGLWAALQREQAKGKIRHLGLSISPPTNLYQTEARRRRGGRQHPGHLQPPPARGRGGGGARVSARQSRRARPGAAGQRFSFGKI
jgi:myo-inositol catabolism protein IolS